MDIERLYENVKEASGTGDSSLLSRKLSGIHPSDIAEIYDLLDDDQRSQLILAVRPAVAAQVVVQLDDAERHGAIDEGKSGGQ